MDDSDDALYHPDGSDMTFTMSQRETHPSRPQTPEQGNDTESVASDPPSALRRSTRRPQRVQRLDPSVEARVVLPQAPRDASTHKPGTRNHTIQSLLKLPGFSFTSETNVFSAGKSSRLAYLLGVQSAPVYNDRAVIARNQSTVSVRIADMLELCCDEWLEWWQDGPLTKQFWVEVAEGLRCHKKYWASREPNATGEEVCMISLAYTRHWDKNGRGNFSNEEASWGFELENAARDFLECIRESEVNFGPIEAAERARNTDRNRSATRNGSTRSLVAQDSGSRAPRLRTTNMNKAHQFILGGSSDVVIVSGPRHRSNDHGQGSFSDRARATVERSDPHRLLVTFSDFLDKFQGKQEAPRSDEGKDVQPQAGSGEDVEMS
ncbi:hypothetical protein DHEL01_v202211 [Diaporthe helianthi]|uniref:Uncharacterized protein n=1 Tax=Diaporthe helianthi TaxID=158607 RepID=A0A2P5IA60_DIAHE|nr:hypothetical protein DHEL01_v202211 [Diaporthe helianthi]